MRLFVFFFLSILVSSAVSAKDKTGYKDEFIAYCQNIKQPTAFCKCALDYGPSNGSIPRPVSLKKKIQSQKKSVAYYLKYSQKLDPSLKVEQFNALCDLSDTYQKEIKNYYTKVAKKPLSEYDQDEFYQLRVKHHDAIENIKNKYIPKNKKLHGQFGSNKITRRHYLVEGTAGYCMQRRILAEDIASIGKPPKKVRVNFTNVLTAAIKPGSACLNRYKKPTQISEWIIENFWTSNNLPVIMHAIYYGDESVKINDRFKTYYRALQIAYDGACKKELPRNSEKRGAIITYESGKIEDNTLFVAPRFLKKYDEYESAHNRFSSRVNKNTAANIQKTLQGGLGGLGNLGGISSTFMVNQPAIQFARFINTTGCKSNDLKLLRENFLRRANRQPLLK